MPGPKVKPTISTSADVSYDETRRRAAAQKLRQIVDGQWRNYWEQLREYERQLEAGQDDVELAQEWIHDHGGTVAKALMRTHPDHGGLAAEFQRTLWARDVLRRR